jgi:hypothetical protein
MNAPWSLILRCLALVCFIVAAAWRADPNPYRWSLTNAGLAAWVLSTMVAA